jgi:DNA replication protein DnaC
MKDELYQRAKQLGFYGLIGRWSEVAHEPWLPDLLATEMAEREQRSFQRRLREAKIGNFKPVADFDWDWPKEIDRALVEDLFHLEFLQEPANVILVGSNGLGKTMIAQNLAYHAIVQGYTVCFTTASALLHDLSTPTSDLSLQRRLARYSRPQLLVIDEIGYLSYDARHADLLFEVVTQRYQQRSIVMTTNKVFQDWPEVFPNATSVVTLVDRLIHRAEIVRIGGESFRAKEAKERAAQRTKQPPKAKK